ncbi:MAG: Na+/H+ antiporter subunit G [bacterium]
MHIAVEITIAAFLVVGALLAFIGSWGLAKLNDFYMRLHAPTKATTLGLGCMLVASSVYFTTTSGAVTLHEALITVFLFITAPASAHILAKTALHEHFPYEGGQPDPLDHPLNVQTRQVVDATGVDE